MWIVISWLLMKPADLDLQCFQNRIDLCSAGQGLINYGNNKTVVILDGSVISERNKVPNCLLTQ